MTIRKNCNGSALTLAVEGRLLVMDFTGMEYISSAGLRVLLTAQKAMNVQGSMRVTGVNEIVNEIFEITGFSTMLTIV